MSEADWSEAVILLSTKVGILADRMNGVEMSVNAQVALASKVEVLTERMNSLDSSLTTLERTLQGLSQKAVWAAVSFAAACIILVVNVVAQVLLR